VTFFPLPSVVLGRAAPFYLTSNEEKLAQLDQLGLDLVVVVEFTRETAQIRAALQAICETAEQAEAAGARMAFMPVMKVEAEA
jgi:hypothetical protein